MISKDQVMLRKDYVDSFLNELEKITLQKFADDEQLQAVVKKVLLAGAYQNGTLQPGQEINPGYNFAFSLLKYADMTGAEITNEQVGGNLRACYEGIRSVESAFDIFKEYKTPIEPTEKKNPAR